jgi:hypothetical protein
LKVDSRDGDQWRDEQVQCKNHTTEIARGVSGNAYFLSMTGLKIVYATGLTEEDMSKAQVGISRYPPSHL